MKRPNRGEPRCQILVEYAKWTALSAVRAGCPIRAREPVYRLLDGVAFAEVLCGEASDFNEWHECQTVALCDRAKPHLPETWIASHGREFPVGWSAKLLNVFLKTAVYAGGLGGDGLRGVLHPPLDAGLQNGLKERFRECPDILEKVTFGAIRDITTYEKYRTVIEGCCSAAKELRCSLIEVEQLAGIGLPDTLVSKICGIHLPG